MRCPACGRHMADWGSHIACPDILCDSEEDIDGEEMAANPKLRLPGMASKNSALSLSLVDIRTRDVLHLDLPIHNAECSPEMKSSQEISLRKSICHDRPVISLPDR